MEQASPEHQVPEGFSQLYAEGQDSQEASQSADQSQALGFDPCQTQEPRSARQTYGVGQEPYQAYEDGHGPYQPHEPGYGLYQPGYSPYDDPVPDPEARMLAMQNAKAYLLTSSTTSGLNL